MNKFIYECYACASKEEYADGDRFCRSCGKPINRYMSQMAEKIKSYEGKIKYVTEETEGIRENYSEDVIAKKKEVYSESYKIYNELVACGIKNREELLKLRESLRSKIEKFREKLEKNEETTKEIFYMDSLFCHKWVKQNRRSSDGISRMGKRLYPKNAAGCAVSPVHTYNAYMCLNERGKYFAADILNKRFLVSKNNVLTEGTKNDISLQEYRKTFSDGEIIILPPFNVQYYDRNIYEEFFDFENSENEGLTYLLKTPCILESKGNYMVVKSKGIISFIDESDFSYMKRYYNIITEKLKGNISENFDYYRVLDTLYDSGIIENSNAENI